MNLPNWAGKDEHFALCLLSAFPHVWLDGPATPLSHLCVHPLSLPVNLW